MIQTGNEEEEIFATVLAHHQVVEVDERLDMSLKLFFYLFICVCVCVCVSGLFKLCRHDRLIDLMGLLGADILQEVN